MRNKANALSLLCGAVCLTGLSGIVSAADMQPAVLGNPCAGCHGTDGKSPGPIPALYGLPADYISRAMRDFRDDNRPATVMNRIAKGYSDEEIDTMAKYFAETEKAAAAEAKQMKK